MVSEIANSVPNVVIVQFLRRTRRVALSQPNDCDSTQMDEYDARPVADPIDYSFDNHIVLVLTLCILMQSFCCKSVKKNAFVIVRQ